MKRVTLHIPLIFFRGSFDFFAHFNFLKFISQKYQFLNLQKSGVTFVFKDYLILRNDEIRNNGL